MQALEDALELELLYRAWCGTEDTYQHLEKYKGNYERFRIAFISELKRILGQ